MRYIYDGNENENYDIYTSFGQHLVEVVTHEDQVMAMVEAMNEIDENYSETQIIELFEADGFGFDNIMADLQNNPSDFTDVQIVKIQNAFRRDAEINGW